jgi:hypothetical protein
MEKRRIVKVATLGMLLGTFIQYGLGWGFFRITGGSLSESSYHFVSLFSNIFPLLITFIAAFNLLKRKSWAMLITIFSLIGMFIGSIAFVPVWAASLSGGKGYLILLIPAFAFFVGCIMAANYVAASLIIKK